jgi:hypothetical protein
MSNLLLQSSNKFQYGQLLKITSFGDVTWFHWWRRKVGFLCRWLIFNRFLLRMKTICLNMKATVLTPDIYHIMFCMYPYFRPKSIKSYFKLPHWNHWFYYYKYTGPEVVSAEQQSPPVKCVICDNSFLKSVNWTVIVYFTFHCSPIVNRGVVTLADALVLLPRSVSVTYF